MSEESHTTFPEPAAAAAKPKRAPAKKAVKAKAEVPAPPTPPAPAPTPAPKKVSAKKAAVKKTAPAPVPTPAPAAELPAPAKPARKPKPAPAESASSNVSQPELPLLATPDTTARPRRTAVKRAKPSPVETAVAAAPIVTPAPVARAESAPASTAPDAPTPQQASTEAMPREQGRGERDFRDRDRRDGRGQRDRHDRGPRGPRPDQRQSSEQNQRSDAAPQSEHSQPQGDQRPPRQEEGQGEESNRSRRWKERRNRFKKWKDRRRGIDSGDAPGAEASTGGDSQGADAPPPMIPLGPPEPAEGILELTPKGYGFLRQRSRAFAQFAQDPFISPELIRQFGLREGMFVKGQACKAQRGPQMTEIAEVNNRVPEAMRDLPLFEELKAINPNKRVQLETDKNRLTTRVIDMFTPVGRGQRGLIVAPPRTGKTTLLQHIAEAVTVNHPGMHLILLLVDERPEEVTEFKRVLPNAEIFASSNDQDVKSHTRIAQFAIERAKRLVECGEHVFILLDSITRLARAFNNAKQGGATMSGGVGVGALEIPRRLFAAARNTREAGSLTILATALIETGSRMDDLIFQEFKGTGNMELVLDRKISEQFYYPAVNILKSGTRREELLLQSFQLDKIHMLRRGLAGHKPIEALQRVLSLLERYPSNAQMLVDLPSKS